MAYLSQSQDTNRRSPKSFWNIIKNEEEAGKNPYPGGYKELA
jgi:hypothetical protein